MILPDHRRAHSGRTFAQRWQPCAIEIGHRSPWWHFCRWLRARLF